MKLHVWRFGLAVGTVFAGAFTICAFFVVVAPEATATFIGYLLHIDFSTLTRPITWTSYFAGVLGVSVWTGLWAAVTTGLYNFLISR